MIALKNWINTIRSKKPSDGDAAAIIWESAETLHDRTARGERSDAEIGRCTSFLPIYSFHWSEEVIVREGMQTV